MQIQATIVAATEEAFAEASVIAAEGEDTTGNPTGDIATTAK